MTAAPIIRARGLGRVYRTGAGDVPALLDVGLDIAAGEFVAVMGASGSGKSTFLNLLGALDRATTGTLIVDGVALDQADARTLARLRNATIGVVFQQFNLLARASALENAAQLLLYAGLRPAERTSRAAEALDRVGLSARVHHRPNQPSGGQQQRVAIARALVNRPRILLADEPTGALDSATSTEIMELFAGLNREGITVVLVTHEAEVAAWASRRLTCRDGRLVADTAIMRGAGGQAA